MPDQEAKRNLDEALREFEEYYRLILKGTVE